MIPAEAVEAAAKGIWEARPMERVYEEGSPNYGAAKPWADIKQYQRDRCMTLARFALEAAAPYMQQSSKTEVTWDHVNAQINSLLRAPVDLDEPTEDMGQ